MLQTKHLNKYFGGNHVLKSISLEVESHRTIVIIGSSSSGKPTLLRCINPLETPDSGSISLDGKALNFSRKLPKHQKTAFAKKTGMVFQSFNLFPHKTILENVIEGPVTMLKKNEDKACQDAMELLKRVGLGGKKDSYPHQLSGRQQQRAAIVGVLAVKPEILLFDEPTSALDPELGAGVLSLIKELSQEEHTIIVVTHNMFFTEEVNEEVVSVEKGEILTEGSCNELVNLHNDRVSQFLNYLDQRGGKVDIRTIKNIICFGSLIMDISICCDKIPAMGETVCTYKDCNINPRGKGGNQSVAAAGSGNNVTLIGRVAADEYIHQLIHNFQGDHIDASRLEIDRNAKTDVAFIWVDTEEHNRCVCSLGINARVAPRDTRSYARLFTDSSIVMTTLKHSNQLLEEISLMVQQNDCVLIVGPSSKDCSKLSPEIAGQIDILKPSEVKTEMLTDVRVEAGKDAVQTIYILKEKGIRMPVISLGNRSVVYEYEGRVTYVEGLRVNAIDTAAAGDTFIGSMAAKLSQGYSFRESTDYANRIAAYCVQHRGMQIPIPFEEDVLQ